MFKNITSFIISAVLTAGLATTVAAAPASDPLLERANELSPNAQVCTGFVPTGCVTIPISSASCINFVGGLSFLDKEVSSAVIPNGFVCTFFEDDGCLSSQGGADVIVLQGGTWNFFSVPGTAQTVNFNDLASSFICSPV